MCRPVGIVPRDGTSRPWINGSGGHWFHGDAIFHRADRDAEIAADAFLVDHLELAHPVDHVGDCLMRGVLAGDVAAAALDAEVLVDLRLGDVVEVEVAPVGDIGHRAAGEVRYPLVAGLAHPVLQALDHLLDDLEAIGHGGGADLHVAGTQRNELRRIAPGGDAADAGNGQAVGFRIAGDFRHHVEGNRLHRRAAIAPVGALAVNGRRWRHAVEVDTHDGVDGVDQ